MRKLKTIAVTIFVVLVLIAGGIGGYLWYSTKQQVDQIVTMAKPFAEISYGGIEVSPAGSVGVNKLKIMPNFVNDSVAIGAIRLNAPNILALLNVRRQLGNGQLPETLSLSLDRLEIPLDGGLLGAHSKKDAQRTPFDDLDALGCGSINSLGGTEWQEMGYHNFVTDMKIGYRLNPARNALEFQMDSNTRDWATLNMDIGFAISAPASSMIELATSLTPKLAKLNVAIHDDGFNQRRNKYCAAKAGKAVDAYIADHVRLVAERLNASGIYPGPGLVEAYRRYLTEGGQVIIAATPPAPIDPAELRFYKAEDAIKLAGLTLKVNEKAVTDLSVSWDAAKLTQALGVEPESEPEPAGTVAVPATVQPATTIRKTYHPIQVGDLSQHVGKIAKIKTTTGAQYKGQLDAFVEGIVKITIRKPGGSVTLSLRSNDITDAQVLY
ncbi:MAG TPA: hypothetical protein PKY50_16370 [Candidatus Competibacter sp.]|nr:hypothetical protein [Candidatus Competibacter sp.]